MYGNINPRVVGSMDNCIVVVVPDYEYVVDVLVVLVVGMCSPVDNIRDASLHGPSMLMHWGMDMDHLASVSIPMVVQSFGTRSICFRNSFYKKKEKKKEKYFQ